MICYKFCPPPILKKKINIFLCSQLYVLVLYIFQIHLFQGMGEEKSWLKCTEDALSRKVIESKDMISWSAFHASRLDVPVRKPDISSMLPLFYENAHSTEMVKHGMEVLKKATFHLNPDQVPVITMDQPLFALGKQIQWQWESLAEDKYVVMLGPFHTETMFLKTIGGWLKGSGWTEAIHEADILSSGRADALVAVSSVTKTRYIHQVTIAALHTLMSKAYTIHVNHPEFDPKNSFEEWKAQMREKYPQFMYWDRVMQLEEILCQFVKSLRTGNFVLYVEALQMMMPWVFAFDHVNYARWLTVHIRDMLKLESTHPDVHAEFTNGNFVVHRSLSKFSSIAMDQNHEQLNKQIKGDGGVKGLFNNKVSLDKWLIAGPEIARFVSEFEDSVLEKHNSSLHHEQGYLRQCQFLEDVSKLVHTIEEHDNPFLDTGSELVNLYSKKIMSENAVKTMKNAFKLGQTQYETFWKERIDGDKPLSDTLAKNNLSIFNENSDKKKVKTQKDTLRKDCNLLARMYIGSSTRDADLDEFFAHENQSIPPSLSTVSGELRLGTKADLTKCLENVLTEAAHFMKADTKIIDGATIVNMIKPKGPGTFDDYVEKDILPYIR